MATNAPIEHIVDSLGLEGDAKVDLWTVRLRGVNLVYHFWNGPPRVWQGDTYEGLACQLSGENRSSEGQTARPSLIVSNPAKIFGVFAAEGYFDLATFTRKRLLQEHFLADVNLFQQNVWICARPSEVRSTTMQLELRSPTDMPPWKTPRRTFNPPDYPFVTV